MNIGWMLPKEAYSWIESNIPSGSIIVELGSGHGSIRLSEEYEVWSIEHDEDWIGIASVNYIHAPLVPLSNDSEKLWYDPIMINAEIPSNYDMLLIDGPTGDIGRSGILSHLDIFSLDVPILVDDVQRNDEMHIALELSRITGHTLSIIDCEIMDESIRKFAILTNNS